MKLRFFSFLHGMRFPSLALRAVGPSYGTGLQSLLEPCRSGQLTHTDVCLSELGELHAIHRFLPFLWCSSSSRSQRYKGAYAHIHKWDLQIHQTSCMPRTVFTFCLKRDWWISFKSVHCIFSRPAYISRYLCTSGALPPGLQKQT